MKRNKVFIAALFLFLLPAIMVGILTLFVFFSPAPRLLDGVPFSAEWYSADGKLLRLDLAEDQGYRIRTSLDDVNKDLIDITLIQEDRYFYHHPGVNPFSILRGAFETYFLHSRPVGGSTITMQVVRLRDNFDTRTIPGKLLQIIKALRLEAHYSKKEILEAYFNLAPYGGNIYGAGAASLIYFHQPANEISLPQSLSLAVIPQNPVKRFPLHNDNSEWQEASLRLFSLLPDEKQEKYASLMKIKKQVFARKDLPFIAPHFLNSQVSENLSGKINTTLDLEMQRLLESRISSYLSRRNSSSLDNAAVMLVHYPTMEVRALAGSADFFSVEIEGQVDGTLARRSPGSTLKPFIYALAMEQGLIHPQTLLKDEPSYISEYRPGNFDKTFIGEITAKDALIKSRNIPAIILSGKLKNPGFYSFLQSAGANFPNPEDHYGLSLAVGGAEIDMRSLVKMYAMLASKGQLNDLHYFKDYSKQEDSISLLSPEVSILTLSMLEHSGSGKIPFASSSSSLPVYWKTGTSNGFRDAWTVGVFGPYVMAVWTGHFDGRSNPALVGSRAAAPLFFDIVRAISARENLKDLIGPEMNNLELARIPVCRKTGSIETCSGSRQQGWFIPGKSPFVTDSLFDDKLEIISPREGILYSCSYGDEDDFKIPLKAKHSGSSPIYWFAGSRYLGSAKNEDETVYWSPKPGDYTIRAVYEDGSSASRSIKVITAE